MRTTEAVNLELYFMAKYFIATESFRRCAATQYQNKLSCSAKLGPHEILKSGSGAKNTQEDRRLPSCRSITVGRTA
jgi:hypothetical protein